jgi:hypothetical protein
MPFPEKKEDSSQVLRCGVFTGNENLIDMAVEDSYSPCEQTYPTDFL